MIRMRINCDDVGMHPSINRAAVALLSANKVSSVSIMAMAPAFDDAVHRLLAIGRRSVGVHLALEAEFANLPMAPLTPARSLVGPDGRLCVRIQAANLDQEEVHRELEAQIERVLAAGLTVTHLDGHMFVYDRPGSPAWLSPMVAGLADRYGVPYRRIEGKIAMIWDEAQEVDERREIYRKLFETTDLDGLELIVHPGDDRQEMETFTRNGVRRLADYLVLRDDISGWLTARNAVLCED